MAGPVTAGAPVVQRLAAAAPAPGSPSITSSSPRTTAAHTAGSPATGAPTRSVPGVPLPGLRVPATGPSGTVPADRVPSVAPVGPHPVARPAPGRSGGADLPAVQRSADDSSPGSGDRPPPGAQQAVPVTPSDAASVATDKQSPVLQPGPSVPVPSGAAAHQPAVSRPGAGSRRPGTPVQRLGLGAPVVQRAATASEASGGVLSRPLSGTRHGGKPSPNAATPGPTASTGATTVISPRFSLRWL